MAKNKNNTAKTKSSRFNAEMAEEAGTKNLNAKNANVNANVNDQTNK
jgi:hypothetical protein